MSGWYERVELEPTSDPKRINFVRGSANKPENDSPDAVKLVKEIMNLNRVIMGLFTQNGGASKLSGVNLRQRVFEDLRAIAELGLVDGNLIDAGVSIDTFKSSILDVAYKKRSEKLAQYGNVAAFGLILLVLCHALHNIPLGEDGSVILQCIYIASGSLLGIYIEFILRTRTLQFDDVLKMDLDKYSPRERSIVVVSIALCAAFLLYHNVFHLGIGDLNFDKWLDSRAAALMLGGATGFSFGVIIDFINKAKLNQGLSDEK